MTASSRDIFSFTDFREFLKFRYEFEKKADSRFTHRHIADTIGASSSGWFADIVKGRITLTSIFRTKLIALFALRGREAEYFEALVDYAQAGSVDEKNRQMERIVSGKGPKVDLLSKDKFEYYSKWYFAAIRELLLFYPFRGDYTELARRLSPPIRPQQAKTAMKVLQRLDLVAPDENGIYRPRNSLLKKDTAFKSFHLETFLKSNMVLGIESLDRYPKEERDISALTLGLSPQDFENAKEMIKDLRKKLLSLSEKPGLDKQVYQCNFSVFPVTGKKS
jgi:uncharacterized protein (TIGR02147 family)